MKNKFKNWLIAAVILSPALFITACERDFSDKETDHLAGKWRDCATLALMENEKYYAVVGDLPFMTYVEYAPTDYLLSKRVVTYVSYELDTTQAYPYIRHVRKGHYTLKGDSLFVKDYANKNHTYIIKYITPDTMCYEDSKGDLHVFKRYNLELEANKKIQ
ncbi:MAG: hypothetical protein J6P44_06230 [Bacteroidales bacterium]|nr:hypothetical protein [Bacteroidales bacterium]